MLQDGCIKQEYQILHCVVLIEAAIPVPIPVPIPDWLARSHGKKMEQVQGYKKIQFDLNETNQTMLTVQSSLGSFAKWKITDR